MILCWLLLIAVCKRFVASMKTAGYDFNVIVLALTGRGVLLRSLN